jgi:hypothetical protein
VCIDSIPAGAEGYRTIQATESWIATCEPQNLHICKVVVDPASLIPELDESNNVATRSIVACAAPDLTLDSSDIKFFGCHRTKGSTITISAIVHNLGSAAGEATVTFYENSAVIGYDTVHVESGSKDTAGIDHEIQEDSSNICVVISDCMPVEYNETNNQACKTLWSFKRGDVNHDGKITVSDVVYLINYLFKNGPAPIPVTEVGDANYDKTVTVSDVIYLINYLFRGGPAPCESPPGS